MEIEIFEKIKTILESRIEEYSSKQDSCEEQIHEADDKNFKTRFIRASKYAGFFGIVILLILVQIIHPVEILSIESTIAIVSSIVLASFGMGAVTEKLYMNLKYGSSKMGINWIREKLNKKLEQKLAYRREQALGRVLHTFREKTSSLELVRQEYETILSKKSTFTKKEAQALVEGDLISQHFERLDVLAAQETLAQENYNLPNKGLMFLDGAIGAAWTVLFSIFLFGPRLHLAFPLPIGVGLVTLGFGVSFAVAQKDASTCKRFIEELNAKLGDDAIDLQQKNKFRQADYDKAIGKEIDEIVLLAEKMQKAQEELDRMEEEERLQYRLVASYEPVQSLDENLEAAQDAATLDEPSGLGEKPFVMRPISQ